MNENQPSFFVDQYGNQILESKPRSGDDLDVGFGGPIGNLMEKLAYAKQVMEVSDELYPYEKTGVKKSGKITNMDEEMSKHNNKSLKTLREEINDNDDEVTPLKIKESPNVIKPQSKKPTKQKPVYEDENYIYYTKNGVNDDEYDVRKTPSLTQTLLMATKDRNNSGSLPDMSASINENMIKKSRLPDVIKQSFLNNPLTPPKLSTALGGGKLDAITEEFRKQKLIKNKEKPAQELIAVPKNKLREQSQSQSQIPQSKREKIKEQLRPIVEELIREILLERL